MSASLEASLKLEIAQYQAALAKAKGDAQKFRDSIKKTGGGLGNDLFGGLQQKFGGLLPAMGVSAVVAGFRHVTNSMDDLADTALRLGESTEMIQRVGHASQILAGVDAEGLTQNFLKLEKALGDLDNEAVTKAFADLGISASTLAALPLDEKVLLLSDAFQKARATGTGYNDLLDLLGKNAGQLIPMLTQTRETLLDTFDDAHIVPDEEVQRLAALNDQLDSFLAHVKGMGVEIAASVTGWIETTGKGIGQWVSNMQQTLSTLFEGGTLEQANQRILEGLQQQQKNADDAAAAKAAATPEKQKLKERSADTSAADKEAKDAKREADKAAAAEQAAADKIIGAQERAAKLKQELAAADLTTQEKIAAVQQQITDAQNAEASAKAYGDVEGQLNAEIQRLELQKEMVKLRHEETDAIKAAAEEIDKEAEAEQKKREALAEGKKSLAEEIALAQAKASGNDKLVTAMERELKIRAKAKEIQEATGATDEQARRSAAQIIGLNEAAAARGEKIDPVTGKKKMRRRMMGGHLEEAYALQVRDGTAATAFGSHGLSRESGPLSQRAARNADKADAAAAPLTTLEDINKAQLDVLKQGLLG